VQGHDVQLAVSHVIPLVSFSTSPSEVQSQTVSTGTHFFTPVAVASWLGLQQTPVPAHTVPTPLNEGAFACGVSLVEQIELFGVAASALHP
jgi:hypothetical protein